MRTCIFYVRRHICYSAYMVRQFRPSVRLFVRLSVTRVDFIKTAQHIIKIRSLSDRPMILFFVTKGCCVNLTVSPLTGAPNTTGYSNFQPICGYILETVLDRGVFTVEDEYIFVCALSNSVAFNDLELPRTLVSRSHIV